MLLFFPWTFYYSCYLFFCSFLILYELSFFWHHVPLSDIALEKRELYRSKITSCECQCAYILRGVNLPSSFLLPLLQLLPVANRLFVLIFTLVQYGGAMRLFRLDNNKEQKLILDCGVDKGKMNHYIAVEQTFNAAKQTNKCTERDKKCEWRLSAALNSMRLRQCCLTGCTPCELAIWNGEYS